MANSLVVAQPESIQFILDENRHTVGAVRVVEEWLAQWTVPNNYPAFVGNRFGSSETYGLPEGALDEWRARLTRSLKTAIPEHPSLRLCDFSLSVRISNVSPTGQFWRGHLVNFML